jgi:hypothetical protein
MNSLESVVVNLRVVLNEHWFSPNSIDSLYVYKISFEVYHQLMADDSVLREKLLVVLLFHY